MSGDQEEVTGYMETHTEMGMGTAWGWRLLAAGTCKLCVLGARAGWTIFQQGSQGWVSFQRSGLAR